METKDCPGIASFGHGALFAIDPMLKEKTAPSCHTQDQPASSPIWDNAKQAEISELREMGVMDEINPKDIQQRVPQGIEALPCLWRCDKKDRGNDMPQERARFCAQGQKSSLRHQLIATSSVAQQGSA
eukprot:Plantae.Rhodophyta-Hildenbrandia_rubra.ctg11075.p2 GENE.Plantae.Rhodophyta-Hildenbrandia_rubra.ctg11075~~Plantae.Rhodophyta-Hildenbrandia_rubra.ctg11075.p2  ORF type:complete len:144 (-),score=11.73 Plantae.Rhodophyta-Hildenbrandia_rubra.ctg11075:1233-1616(-)